MVCNLDLNQIKNLREMSKLQKSHIYNEANQYIREVFSKKNVPKRIIKDLDEAKNMIIKTDYVYDKAFVRQQFMYPEYTSLLSHGEEKEGFHKILCIDCAMRTGKHMIELDEVLVNWVKIFTKAGQIESLEAYCRTAASNAG